MVGVMTVMRKNIRTNREKKFLKSAVGCTALFSVLSAMTTFAAFPLVDKGTKVTETALYLAAGQYYTVPASIRDAFEQAGGVVYFIPNEQSGGMIGGYETGSDGKNAIIVLSNRDYGGAEAVTHEMGHFFDDILVADQQGTTSQTTYGNVKFVIEQRGNQYQSDDAGFKYIWMSEANGSAVSSYEKASATEYFSGAFKLYCTAPDKLKASAPQTYNYMNTLVTAYTASHPATAANLALTQSPTEVDVLTGGATMSGIFIKRQ
jgi:hypothetical protein